MLTVKRTLALLISLILIFSVCGCSEVDPDYGVDSNGSAIVIEKKSNYDEDTRIMSSDRVMPTYFDISLFDEENYAEIYLGKEFEIDATIGEDAFPVPTKMADLRKMGWTMAKGNEYNANSLVFSYETIEVTFKNEKGNKIKVYFYNSSRSSERLFECNIVKFRVDNTYYKNSKKALKFNVNGITNTLAITDVIDTLGTPSHFYAVSEDNYYLDYFITKKDRRNGITVYVNPVDDIVTAIEFSYYE